MAEELRFKGRLIEATISRTSNKWHVAIQVEVENAPSTNASDNQAVGVDLGIRALATLSDGTVVTGSRASAVYEKKLRRLDKELSRRKGSKKEEKKSKNFKKTRRKLSRLHSRMANIRSDQTHKLTTMLIQNYGLIGIEDLNVKGMMCNHKLARSVADRVFFEFRRQLMYKAEAANARVVVADRWYASSKICHVCGMKFEELTIGDRSWTCSHCGVCHDRDLNASINLRNYALGNT